jgi:8-oxo-dGTP diphosphatase
MIQVVAGILLNSDGHFLLAKRPVGKIYEGYWEFPGGKVESNEDGSGALIRELKEELGIVPKRFKPWVRKTFHYPHGEVCINFFKVRHWDGVVAPLENQEFYWQGLGIPGVSPLLEPNIPILKSLHFPDKYLITNLAEMGEESFFRQLSRSVEEQPQMIQVREKHLSVSDLEKFVRKVIDICRPSGSRIIVNEHIDIAERLGADGVHLTSAQLGTMTRRPELPLCSASCHTADDLARVDELNLDFAVLSSVKVTQSHPNQIPLGWETFRSLSAEIKTPIYALGGLKDSDLKDAWYHGAVGIAMMRSAWQEILF